MSVLGRRPRLIMGVLLTIMAGIGIRYLTPGSVTPEAGPATSLREEATTHEPMSSSGTEGLPPSMSAAPPAVAVGDDEQGIPSYQWPDEIHPGWRENRSIAAMIDYMVGRSPVKMSDDIYSAVPFREDIDDSSLRADGFGEFVEQGAERCSFPPPSRIDCSEAPCLAFLWFEQEAVRDSKALKDCDPLNNPEIVGAFWVDCPTGRRWVVYFWQRNAWDDAVPADVPRDLFWWRPVLRVMREPPESYCALP